MKAELWKHKSSEEVADCRVFRVRRDRAVRESDQKESDFYVIESPDWINVIALTQENEFVLIEQFRHGAEEMHLELPGGLIDKGEEPLQAAMRELAEETGFTSSQWHLLGSSRPNPAIQNNTIFHFLALDCAKSVSTSFDENENISTTLASSDEVKELLRTGQMNHSLVVAAFQYYEFHSGPKSL